LGFWVWAMGPIPNPQSPIPNPQNIVIINKIFKKYEKKMIKYL
jgi:hypothetical protein